MTSTMVAEEVGGLNGCGRYGGRQAWSPMPELLIGRLAQQVAGLDLERLGELAHGAEISRLAILDATDRGPVEAGSVGQLVLRQQPLHAPVLQGWQAHRRAWRHPAGQGTAHAGYCWPDARHVLTTVVVRADYRHSYCYIRPMLAICTSPTCSGKCEIVALWQGSDGAAERGAE